MTKYIYSGLMILFTVLLSGQNITNECATQPNQNWFSLLKERVPNMVSTVIEKNQMVSIPYQIHLFKTAGGVSNLTLQDVYNEIDSVNAFYANSNIIFVECSPPEIIFDDSLYNYEYSTEEAAVLSQHYTSDVLNMYFPNSASMYGTLICGYSKYPPSEDLVVISSTCAKNGSTLAHEIGHYFGLMHTHEVTGIGELVDGSNCLSDGDYICDTPADPTLSSSNVNTSCVYTGTSVDANNMPYSPDVTNIMSYSRKVCRNYFSPTQYTVINNTMQTERTNLNCLTTNIVEQSPDFRFEVFPNPGDEKITVFTNNYERTEVLIYNSVGELVHTEFLESIAHEINTEKFPNGIYFYQVKFHQLSFTGKWVKSN